MNAVQITSFYIKPPNGPVLTNAPSLIFFTSTHKNKKFNSWLIQNFDFKPSHLPSTDRQKDCSQLWFWQVNVHRFSKEKYYFVLSALNVSQVTSRRGSDNRTSPAKQPIYWLKTSSSHISNHTVTSGLLPDTRQRGLYREEKWRARWRTFSSSPALILPASRKWNFWDCRPDQRETQPRIVFVLAVNHATY